MTQFVITGALVVICLVVGALLAKRCREDS